MATYLKVQSSEVHLSDWRLMMSWKFYSPPLEDWLHASASNAPQEKNSQYSWFFVVSLGVSKMLSTNSTITVSSLLLCLFLCPDIALYSLSTLQLVHILKLPYYCCVLFGFSLQMSVMFLMELRKAFQFLGKVIHTEIPIHCLMLYWVQCISLSLQCGAAAQEAVITESLSLDKTSKII